MSRGFQILPDFKGRVLMPRRDSKFSSSYLIHSAHDAIIEPRNLTVIGTGLTVYMENDEELQLRPRASLAYRASVILFGSPMSVDADFFGSEIKLLMYNCGDEPYHITRGEAVAEGVFSKYLKIDEDIPMR